MDKIDINFQVNRLLNYGLQRGLMCEADYIYTANRLINMLGLKEFAEAEIHEDVKYVSEILEEITQYAVDNNLIEDSGVEKEIFDTELMNVLMPRPSEVKAEFYRLYSEGSKKATDYYYRLSRNSNYIRTDRVAKDKLWSTNTKYGDLIITINLSKPEKDPKDIAAAKNAVQSGYPKCALCRENEGYRGSLTQAARANHRLIPFNLAGGKWFLQYSPYVYYNEHCIILNEKHTPMQIDKDCMGKLLEFTQQFPHYFVGSNADLPIVGGSILSHEHFQGGSFEFPMAKAKSRADISFEGFQDIKAAVVDWPMSVIRLSGEDKDRILELAGKVLDTWRGYSDEAADILAFTAGEGDLVPHNTITPIARRRDGKFELDLVLRNNRTTQEHPLGIFHPHSQYHHIKKENIGLIEVMGLAILPPRLVGEMELIKEALLNPEAADTILARPEMAKNREWYLQLKEMNLNEENAEKAIKDSISNIFMKILGNAGVYKDNDEGNKAFMRFIDFVNKAAV